MDWITFRLDDTTVPNRLYATNLSAMPVDLGTSMGVSTNTKPEPPQPARMLVPPLATVQVAAFGPEVVGRAWSYKYVTSWELGDPAASAAAVPYKVPLAGAASRAPILQGPGGSFSHTDRLGRYARDYQVPTGTPVVAARSGTVATLDQGFTAAGTDPSFSTRGNEIRVLHDDGSWAVYLHLEARSARVRIGDHVNVGQILGLSGNTGRSTRPHLHLAVLVNQSHLETSVPYAVEPP